MRTLVFARSPVPGQVKTRLFGALGPEGACALYRLLLEHALAVAAASDIGPVEIWAAEAEPTDTLWALARRHGARLALQGSGDLGMRMDRALRATLAAGALPVLVGSDVPALTPALLRSAAAELEAGRPAVFAPASDGGYGLIGVSRPLPGLFEAISWGGSDVMAETRHRLRTLRLDHAELEPVWDVDRAEDLARLEAIPELCDWRRRIGAPG